MSRAFRIVPKRLICRPFHSSTGVYAGGGWERLKDAKDRNDMWDFLKDLEPDGEKDESDPFAEILQEEVQSKSERPNIGEPRPKQVHYNRGATTSSNTTEKERQIFSRILDSILTQSDKGRSKSVTSSVQALFEQNSSPESDHGISRSFLPAGGAANVKLNITTDDVRKLPLSYGSLIRQSRSDKMDRSAEYQRLTRARNSIAPILTHISNLPSDLSVIEYFTGKVLDRFEHHMSSEAISEAVSDDVSNPPLTPDVLPIYLEHCMSVLTDVFQEPNEAITLFELSKSAGIEFYAHACGVGAYNQMLRIRWNYFWDIQAIDALVMEMHVNAVQGNEETSVIIGNIIREYYDVKQEVGGFNGMPLWGAEEKRRVGRVREFRLKVAASLAKLETVSMHLNT